FIKWKPTVLYWLFAIVLFIAHRGFGKNLIRTMMKEQIKLPEPVWGKLNTSWSAFFGVMGAINLYVAYNYSTDIWVDFKLFGLMGLMFVFIILQALFLGKYIENNDDQKV